LVSKRSNSALGIRHQLLGKGKERKDANHWASAFAVLKLDIWIVHFWTRKRGCG
jgi:hypothetical protein